MEATSSVNVRPPPGRGKGLGAGDMIGFLEEAALRLIPGLVWFKDIGFLPRAVQSGRHLNPVDLLSAPKQINIPLT